MLKDVIIVGAGGCGREVAEIFVDVNYYEPTWNILGFIDDDLHALDGKNSPYKILGTISDWEVKPDQLFAMGIADPKTKEIVAKKLLAKGAKFTTAIHPQVKIGAGAKLSRGLVMYSLSSIGPDCEVGEFTTLLSTGLGHDVKVGKYCTISSNTGINGHVELGDRVMVGSHAVIAPGKKVGDDAIVGVGSVVVSNVKAGTTVFGNPAKRIDKL